MKRRHPTSTPSRAALLTGCYPERVGNLRVLFPEDSKGLNPKETTPHEAYFYRTNGVRVGSWKLIDGKLFDLSQDVSESNDISKDYPGTVERLATLLSEHKQEIDRNSRPFGTPARTKK